MLAQALMGLSGCHRQQAQAGAPTAAAGKAGISAPPLLLAPEDLVTVSSSAFAGGVPITGSIRPEREADLRAELAAVVVAVAHENGDPVRRGELLVRLDDTAIRDSLTAADAALRAASLALEQSERQFQRMSTLREGGMVSAPQLEEAEARRNGAQSEAEAARTRVVSARQQLQRTEVRAPFDGVVSDRKVSAGDTVQVGKELVKVIDPRSLRFEGLVSASNIASVRPGQHVSFRIQGQTDTDFAGVIARVNPMASASTRQVEVLVGFADPTRQPRVAGLYAEGRVEAAQSSALTLPSAAIVRDGDRAFAWRVSNGRVNRVALQAGDRDARTGEVVIHEGLARGDRVLHYPSSTLQEGQAVQISGEKPALPVSSTRVVPAVAASSAAAAARR